MEHGKETGAGNMRNLYSDSFLLILAITLGVCAAAAFRSRKSIGRPVSLLLLALLPPVLSNLFLIRSGNLTAATAGFHVYFLGMSYVMLAFLHFTIVYCRLRWPNRILQSFVGSLFLLDQLLLLLNPILGVAFTTSVAVENGVALFHAVPLLGLRFHRVVCYGAFFAIFFIFLFCAIRAPRINAERYYVMLAVTLICCVWQTYYIVTGAMAEQSMVGFGMFGLMVFYFSICYRPMRLLDKLLADTVSDMGDALFYYDAAGECIWANGAGAALAQVTDGRFEPAAERLDALFGKLPRTGGEWTDKRMVGMGESAKRYSLERHAVMDGRGRESGSFLRVTDMTEEENEIRRRLYAAVRDSLTGIYTREHLHECIVELLKTKPDERYLVLSMDVSGFKIVNDIFGSDFGDLALRAIADWLRAEFDGRALYGRLSGDKFGVFTPAAAFDAARIERRLSDFVVSDGKNSHQLLIHMGVYELPDASVEPSVMFGRAALALGTIRNDYRTHIAYYDDKMRSEALWRRQIASQLSDAIADGQIRPYLQPMGDAAGRVVGAEVLVRWQHPEQGLLSPARFIPIFEDNGMIADVDRHMWRCACDILARWEAMGHGELFLSVNISPVDFYFMDVSAEIKAAAEASGVSPSRLRLEITETVMMTEAEKRMAILHELKTAGFLVEMDDFGSGYSSLNMLKDMPVDVLKIDMIFLNKTKDGFKARTILHNIIRMSDSLGIVSLTEGIETEEQYRILSDMGCKFFQGFYFAKPMPVEEFERRFLSGNAGENAG